MQDRGAIAFILISAGLVGYLLFNSIGIWGAILTFGILSAGFFMKQGVRFAHAKGGLIGKWMRISYEFFDGNHRGRREALAAEQKARLEALRIKAHLLARNCGDTYGARSCCLEIISQTAKEDPLFVEACDLYMDTVFSRSQQKRESRHRMPFNASQRAARPETATVNVIPFPSKPD